VTRLNIATLAALATAPPPPAGVKLTGAVTPDTTLAWTASPNAVAYRVWWRDTDATQWSPAQSRRTTAVTLTLPGVNIDDFAFGVSAIAADGAESPVEFPGAVGAFVQEAAISAPVAK
jgi:hypothetical protein